MKVLAYTVPAVMDGKKVVTPGKCELMDVPEPELQPRDGMKVKIDYCALCATDVHMVTLGLFNRPTPWRLGHELVGTIAEVNQKGIDAGFKVGDRVIVNNEAPCGECEECLRGNTVSCKRPIRGSFKAGFGEYCTAQPKQCFKIPENPPVDYKYYCLAEPTCSAMDGINMSGIKMGDNVFIQGCGAIGSILLNLVLLNGGTRVTVSDPIPEKRELALKMGAQYVIDPKTENLVERGLEITDGRGYDVIFDMAGIPAAAPQLLKLLAFKGTCVYFAVFPMDYELPVNLYDLFTKEGRIQMAYTHYYNYPRVLDIIPRLNLDLIVTKEMKLSDGTKIMDEYFQSKNNKIIVKCNE